MDSGRNGAVAGLARLAVAGGLIALAAGAIPGCVIALGGTKHVVVVEPPVDQQRLDQIRLGETTEDQVRDLLGSPTTRVMSNGDTQTWTYKTSGTKKSGATVAYIDEDDEEIRTETIHRGKVVIEFKDGVVTAVRKE
ncbi:MAG: outer membrane protein assembly factor BamE domain-containing protein [Phycisphaerales bacterium]